MRRLSNPNELGTFALLVLVGFVVARFTSAAVHEVLGHGLFAAVLGGTFYGVYLSPTSGFALVFLSPLAPSAARALVALAGILVEIAVGAALFAAYPRIRTFVGRLFVLLLLQVFLVYTLVYLSLGAFVAAGDPALAVAALGAPYLTVAFLAVGLLWAIALVFVISKEVLRLVGPESPFRLQLLYILLFWITPLAVALPGLAFTPLLPLSPVVYLLLFALVAGGVFASAAFLAPRDGPSSPPPVERPVGRLWPIVVSCLIVISVSVAVFGPTQTTAHGLLLREAPIDAEQVWANPQAINVQVRLTPELDVVLEFRFKGVPELDAPLEQRVWESYEARAYFPYWIDVSTSIAAAMMNVTSTAWTARLAYIDAVGVMWFDGRDLIHPRVVVLEASPEYKPLLTNVTQNGTRTFVGITVRDPFRYSALIPCLGCFLDEVDLAWPGARRGAPQFLPVNLSAVGGLSEPLVDYDPAEDLNIVRFRNRTASEAHATYVLVLERLAA